MKIIYPRFPNYTFTSKFIKNIDEERMLIETDSEREIQIENYEEGCGVYILTSIEFDFFDKPLLTHEGFDPITNWEEIDEMFYFNIGGYEYSFPKHGEPIFYKMI